MHVNCTDLTVSQFLFYAGSLVPHYCMRCLNSIFSFSGVETLDQIDPELITCKAVQSLNLDAEPYISLKTFEKIAKNLNVNDFTIVHCNVRSLTKNLNKMEDVINTISHLPDLIAISETKLSDSSNVNQVWLSGYDFVNSNSDTSAGGVGLYIKSCLKYVVRPELQFKVNGCENIWVELISTRPNAKNIVIAVIYRHPFNKICDFINELESSLIRVSEKEVNFYCIGDINIDLNNFTKKTYDYQNLMNSYGLTNLITNPTRVTNSSATLLDHFLTSDDTSEFKSFILTCDVSDHFVLFVAAKNIKFPQTWPHKKLRKSLCNNWDDFFLDVESNMKSIHASLTPQTDVNMSFHLLMTTLTGILNQHQPYYNLSKKQRKLKAHPWITNGILTSIKTRDKLFRKLCKINFSDVTLHTRYKKYRNFLTHVKELSKKLHYQNELSCNSGNSTKIWNTINHILGKKKCRTNKMQLIEVDGKRFESPHQITEIMNTYFSEVGSNLAKQVHTTKITYKHFMKNRISNSMVLEDTCPEEILIISSLDSNKATGPYDIPIKTFKSINLLISPILSEITNQCFKTGTFPNLLKLAKVIPLHKGGKVTQPNNYRPISLLCVISKIIERVILHRLKKFCNKYNVITENQFGFREGYSTSLAVASVYENMLCNLEKGLTACNVFIDLRKAFDSIDHKILLSKLEYYGIRGKVLQLPQSYLSNRLQFVEVNGHTSRNQTVQFGVPQGSVLGPFLFLLYINDFQNASEFKIAQFADDTLSYLSIKNFLGFEKRVNKSLDQISQWINSNKLTINLNKLKFMLVRPSVITDIQMLTFVLKIQNQNLERVMEYKYLGVIFDEKLNWKPHISHLTNRLSKVAGIFYKLRKIVKYTHSSILCIGAVTLNIWYTVMGSSL